MTMKKDLSYLVGEKYFVIVSDGSTISFTMYFKDELEKKLNENWWGPEPFDSTIGDIESGGRWIIKGELITPQAETTVTKWKVD